MSMRYRDALPDRAYWEVDGPSGREARSWVITRRVRLCQYPIEGNCFLAVLADFGPAARTWFFWLGSSCIYFNGVLMPMPRTRVALSHSRVTRFTRNALVGQSIGPNVSGSLMEPWAYRPDAWPAHAAAQLSNTAIGHTDPSASYGDAFRPDDPIHATGAICCTSAVRCWMSV